MKGISKKEFIERLADDISAAGIDIPKKRVIDFTDVFIQTLKNVIIEHNKINFSNFGVFNFVGVNARKARNVVTGEVIDVPAKQKVKFSPSKAWMSEINNS